MTVVTNSPYIKLKNDQVAPWWSGVYEHFKNDVTYQDDLDDISHKVQQGRCFVFLTRDYCTAILLSYIEVEDDALCVEFLTSSKPNAIHNHWACLCDIATLVNKQRIVCRPMTDSRTRLFKAFGFKEYKKGWLSKEVRYE